MKHKQNSFNKISETEIKNLFLKKTQKLRRLFLFILRLKPPLKTHGEGEHSTKQPHKWKSRKQAYQLNYTFYAEYLKNSLK